MTKIVFKNMLLAVGCLIANMAFCACSSSSDTDEDLDLGGNDIEEGIQNGQETAASQIDLDSMVQYCQRDTFKIYGKLYRPKNITGRIPAVILSHSSSLTHAAMKSYAINIAKKGIATYCFDFCGGSSASQSSGSTDSMTVFTEVEDLRAVVDNIRSLDFVNPDSLFLLGSSQGGLVTALLSEEIADKVCGQILFYPAFNIPDMVKQFGGTTGGSGTTGSWGDWGNFGDWGDFGDLGDWSDLIGSWGDAGGMTGMTSMSEKYIESIKDFDVWSHIGTYKKPVTIVHGSSDIIVAPSYSEKAVEKYGSNAKLYLIEGANHGFNADNLGSMGAMMGATTDYDSKVMPYVYKALNR